ncbi:MAG: hypothetical protein HYW91_03035 [Candidatus Sungbacteria bacterium]|nr:hypothetical protein [Candidatus Sungbacteria bacterium]
MRWPPVELLWRAENLAETALLSPHVTGIALTGSLARKEPLIHDIDLVVLHDGTLPVGGISDPCTADASHGKGVDLTYGAVFQAQTEEKLREQRGLVPVNYICVPERALWDCSVLQSLKEHERFPDFYLRVFTDIPLFLLRPLDCLFMLLNQHRYAAHEIISIGRHGNQPIEAVRLKHLCGNYDCVPKQTWEECKEEIRRRKNHHWHD